MGRRHVLRNIPCCNSLRCEKLQRACHAAALIVEKTDGQVEPNQRGVPFGKGSGNARSQLQQWFRGAAPARMLG
jgi:hypothetical protein